MLRADAKGCAMRRLSWGAGYLSLCCVLALGCGDDDGSEIDAGRVDAGGVDSGGVDSGGVDSGGLDSGGIDSGGGVDAGGGARIELLAGEWTMSASNEGYVCVRKTMTETVFIREFAPIAPLGTHHTVLTIDDSPGPDGVATCGPLTNGPDMIYGSGVGTEPLAFPAGVAIKVEAGQQLLLNLHLFNASGAAITGRSGIEVVTLPEAEVVHEAQVVLAGNEFFAVPPRASAFEVDGRCTMTGDTTVFAIMPHMHQYGTFMEVETGGTILHEGFYSFDAQAYTTFDPMALSSGTSVNVTCRYDNTTDSVVRFGESTLDEMCYAVLYRYPAIPNPAGITCTN